MVCPARARAINFEACCFNRLEARCFGTIYAVNHRIVLTLIRIRSTRSGSGDRCTRQFIAWPPDPIHIGSYGASLTEFCVRTGVRGRTSPTWAPDRSTPQSISGSFLVSFTRKTTRPCRCSELMLEECRAFMTDTGMRRKIGESGN